ncbi:MAG: hypothetical protein ACYCVH_10640 [Ignavibacteriaceae bacterium]
MSDTFLRKDIAYLYNKLAKINTTAEQILFLSQEKNCAERLVQCLAEKKISFLKYVLSDRKFFNSTNNPELYNISIFISRFIKRKQSYCGSIRNMSFYLFRYQLFHYFIYVKFRNYFINLLEDYIKIIEKEASICNEELRLGFYNSKPEKYLEYVGRIRTAKGIKDGCFIKRGNENIIDLKYEEFALLTDKENKSEDFKVLFISPKALDKELSKEKNDMGKIILLLELKKNIKKILLGFGDINITTLEFLQLKKAELLCNAPKVLYYLEFQIDQHNKKHNEKTKLTVDHLYEHVKKKVLELEKLNTIVKNEIKYLDKKRVIVHNLGKSEKGEKNSESEKIKIDGETDPHNLNNNKQVDNRKVWRGTKGEFAVFVNEQYLDNQDRFSSLREATNYLFEKYRFKWGGWTKEMCYDYVKKK